MNAEGAEDSIREAFDAGDLAAAATRTMQAYGPEILGLLVAIHRDREEAKEAFSAFTERLWRTLPGFAWRCSMRTWAYLVARRASRDVRRAGRRRALRDAPLSDVPELSRMAVRVRTETMTFLQTQNKNAIAELRETLSEEGQTLLILRVDRDLAWNDLAVVFLQEEGEATDPAALKREAARLRERYQLVKDRLLALGREKGLIDR